MSKRTQPKSREFQHGKSDENKETDKFIDKILGKEATATRSSDNITRRQVAINSNPETSSLLDESEKSNHRAESDDDDEFEPTCVATASRVFLLIWGAILALGMAGGVIYFGVHFKYLASVWPLGCYLVVGSMIAMCFCGILLFFAALFRRGCCLQTMACILAVVMLLIGLGGLTCVALLDQSELLYKSIGSQWNANVNSKHDELCEFQKDLKCAGWKTACRFLNETHTESPTAHPSTDAPEKTTEAPKPTTASPKSPKTPSPDSLFDRDHHTTPTPTDATTRSPKTEEPVPSTTLEPSKSPLPPAHSASPTVYDCPVCAGQYPVAPPETEPPSPHTETPDTSAPKTDAPNTPTPHTEGPTGKPHNDTLSDSTNDERRFEGGIIVGDTKSPDPSTTTKSPQTTTSVPSTTVPHTPSTPTLPPLCDAALKAKIKHETGPVVGGFVGIVVFSVIEIVALRLLKRRIHEAFAYEA